MDSSIENQIYLSLVAQGAEENEEGSDVKLAGTDIEKICSVKSRSALYRHLDGATNALLFFCGLDQRYRDYSYTLLSHFHLLWNFIVLFFSFGVYFGIVMKLCIDALRDEGITMGVLYVLLILQMIGLLISTYYNYRRLCQNKFEKLELHFYQESHGLILKVFLPVVFISFLPFIIFVLRNSDFTFRLIAFLCFVFQTFLFSVSLLFILVDVSVCKFLLTVALKQIKENDLTLRELETVRQEINSRVQYSELTNNILMAVGVCNVLILFVILFVDKSVFADPKILILLAFFMSREFIFMLLAFWEVGKVNELSDELIKNLSRLTVAVENDDRRTTTATVGVEEGKHPKELLVYKLFINALGDPISFQLTGMRLTRKDLVARIAVWLVGIVIGGIGQEY
jgi:hypothetical protein